MIQDVLFSGYFDPKNPPSDLHLELARKLAGVGGLLTLLVHTDEQARAANLNLSSQEKRLAYARLLDVSMAFLSVDRNGDSCDSLRYFRPTTFVRVGQATPAEVDLCRKMGIQICELPSVLYSKALYRLASA